MPPALLDETPPELTAGWPASLQLLLGPAATDLWSTVLATSSGELDRLRPISVTLQPSNAATVQYAAHVAWPDGRTTRETLAATTGARIPPGAAVLAGDVGGETVEVGVWRWPQDPALPGLCWATTAAAVAEQLSGLGVPVRSPRLRLRSYRPGRRAVVEVTSATERLFLKVVRPAALDRLVQQHAALAGAVPVPPVLAVTPDGVAVLPGLPGTPLRRLLEAGGTAADLPDAAGLDALLDALPSGTGCTPGRSVGRGPLDSAARHAAVLGLVTAPLRPRLDRLAAAIAAADPGEHPVVPVHGDFYEAQVLVEDGAVTGLLDLDTVGVGHRIDDWATLLGHLVLLAEARPGRAATRRYAGDLWAAAERRWPAGQLRTRVAAVLLGLATGPFRVQQRGWPALTETRVALAEHTLAGT